MKKYYIILLILTLFISKSTSFFFSNDSGEDNNNVKYQIPSTTLTIFKKKKQIDAVMVKSGHTLIKSLEANERDKHSLRVSFYCVEANEKNGDKQPAKPHQTFVAFTNIKSNRDTFFLAKLDKDNNNNNNNNNGGEDLNNENGNHYVATIDLSKEAGRFKSESSNYDITIFVGGPDVPSGYKWKFGSIKLNFNEINNDNNRKTQNQLFDEIFDSSIDLTTSKTKLKEIKIRKDENDDDDHEEISTVYLSIFTSVNILILLAYVNMNMKSITSDGDSNEKKKKKKVS